MNESGINTERILIADDDPTNVTLLARSLDNLGYRVLVATDGQQALELARLHHPDLMFLDIMMPQHDGLEVCALLKSQVATANIPIIFVTAQSESGDVVRALSVGGSDYVTKPFIISEVMARMSVHLRLRRTERELLARNAELQNLSHQLSTMNAELSRISRTDPLTGLLNRRAWQESVLLEEERSRRHHHGFSIVMIDVDHFKKLNDSIGHQAGDECLYRIARGIDQTCRSIDLIGRYGGEELVILAPETDRAAALGLAERIRSAIENLRIVHPSSPIGEVVTISIGVASGTEAWENIVNRADAALYEAKRSGRNRVAAEPEVSPAPAPRREAHGAQTRH